MLRWTNRMWWCLCWCCFSSKCHLVQRLLQFVTGYVPDRFSVLSLLWKHGIQFQADIPASEQYTISNWFATLTLTDLRVPDVSQRVLVEELLTLLAVDTNGVVHAVITHTPAHKACGLEARSVKVTLGGMVVAVALWIKKIKIIKLLQQPKPGFLALGFEHTVNCTGSPQKKSRCTKATYHILF